MTDRSEWVKVENFGCPVKGFPNMELINWQCAIYESPRYINGVGQMKCVAGGHIVNHVYPVHSSCDIKIGPSGAQECVSLSKYRKYQYGTCITDAYMQQKSNHKHYCEDRTAKYCYYQCMLELHDENSGDVTDDCACGPDAPSGPSENVTKTTPIPLDPECYSPDGTQCTWYRNCLEKRFPCRKLNNSYALDYGEKFCNIYTDHYNGFDDVGKKWVDAVRKCLQVALVPLLRPFNTVKCEQIKDIAFGTHSGCYVSPPDGARSVCDIGFKNMLTVLATIKSTVFSWATIKQGFSTSSSCICKYITRFVHVTVKSTLQLLNSTSTAKMINDIENAVSALMSKEVFVYTLPECTNSRTRRSSENVTAIITNVLFLPRAEYDLNYFSNGTVNVTNVVDGFLDGLADGSLQLSLPWPIQDIRQCDEVKCEHPTRTVVPKSPAKANDINKAEEHTSISVIIGAIVGVCAVVIIAITILMWWKCRK